MEGFGLSETIDLPINIKYYDYIDGKYVEVFEIKKDTKILLYESSYVDESIRYGYHSLPTYEKGWRFAEPFSTINNDGTMTRYNTPHYVRLSDLKSLLNHAYTRSPIFLQQMEEMGAKKFGIIFLLLTQVDYSMASDGIYLSPDLEYPILDTYNILLIVAISILLLIQTGVWVYCAKTRFRKKSEN